MLALTSYTPEDRAFFVGLFTDPEFTQHIGGVRTAESAGALFDALQAGSHARAVAAYAIRHAGIPIGHGVIFRTETEGVLEFGYGLDRRVWGRGHGTEAARQLLEAVWNLGVEHAIASVDLENTASVRLLTTLGGSPKRVEDEEGPYWVFDFRRPDMPLLDRAAVPKE